MLLMICQSLFGAFGEEEANLRDAWGWFLPTLMPTFSLIIGVLVVDLGTGATRAEKQVDRFLYRTAFWLSLGYLVIVALPILIAPFVRRSNLELMQMTHYWLGPLQGLVAAVLGAFFLKGEEKALEERVGVANN